MHTSRNLHAFSFLFGKVAYTRFFPSRSKKKKKKNKSIIYLDLLGFFPWAHLGTVGPRLSALCRPPPCIGTSCCNQ